MAQIGNLGCFLSGLRRRNTEEPAYCTPFTKLPLPWETHREHLALKTPPTGSLFFLLTGKYRSCFLNYFILFYFKQVIPEKENNFL